MKRLVLLIAEELAYLTMSLILYLADMDCRQSLSSKRRQHVLRTQRLASLRMLNYFRRDALSLSLAMLVSSYSDQLSRIISNRGLFCRRMISKSLSNQFFAQ